MKTRLPTDQYPLKTNRCTYKILMEAMFGTMHLPSWEDKTGNLCSNKYKFF